MNLYLVRFKQAYHIIVTSLIDTDSINDEIFVQFDLIDQDSLIDQLSQLEYFWFLFEHEFEFETILLTV